jgi:hypothetical protein
MTTTFPEPLWALPTWAMEATEPLRVQAWICYECARNGPPKGMAMKEQGDKHLPAGECESCYQHRFVRLFRFWQNTPTEPACATINCILDGPMLGETP